MSSWSKPGWRGAALYTTLATVLGAVVTLISRLTVERQRGRARMVKRLPGGPIIVISNHTSYADGVLLALACRRLGRSLRLLATGGVFRAPVLGRVARRLGFIPVARGEAHAAEALDAAVEALAAGEAVGIFPEGRITRDPRQWPERAKTGAVRLALRSGAPIVPIAMVGAHEVVGRRRIVWTLLSNLVRRPRVDVEVGDPIDVRELIGGTASPTPDQIREAADVTMERLIALVELVRGEAAEHARGVVVAESDGGRPAEIG